MLSWLQPAPNSRIRVYKPLSNSYPSYFATHGIGRDTRAAKRFFVFNCARRGRIGALSAPGMQGCIFLLLLCLLGRALAGLVSVEPPLRRPLAAGNNHKNHTSLMLRCECSSRLPKKLPEDRHSCAAAVVRPSSALPLLPCLCSARPCSRWQGAIKAVRVRVRHRPPRWPQLRQGGLVSVRRRTHPPVGPRPTDPTAVPAPLPAGPPIHPHLAPPFPQVHFVV